MEVELQKASEQMVLVWREMVQVVSDVIGADGVGLEGVS